MSSTNNSSADHSSKLSNNLSKESVAKSMSSSNNSSQDSRREGKGKVVASRYLNEKATKPKEKFKSPNLHSTALNDTTFNKTLSNKFSCTVVKQPRKARLETIGDISSIPHFSTQIQKKPTSNDDPEPVSQDSLEDEYLKYLMWAHLDADMTRKLKQDETDAQKQLEFLRKQLKDKQEIVQKKKKLLELIRKHAEAKQRHSSVMKLLQPLVDLSLQTETSLATTGNSLEQKMFQVNASNVYIPSDQESYREDLIEALNEHRDVLAKLEKKVKPNLDQGAEIKHALLNLRNITEAAGQVQNKAEQAAGLSIQEASLKLTNAKVEE